MRALLDSCPLWLGRTLVGVPRGSRVVYPSEGRYVLVLVPSGALWLLTEDVEIEVPDERRDELVLRYFTNAVVKKISGRAIDL